MGEDSEGRKVAQKKRATGGRGGIRQCSSITAGRMEVIERVIVAVQEGAVYGNKTQ
jgi:hypothetical protein